MRERRAVFHVLVHLPDGHNIPGWIRLKLGARNFTWTSYVGHRGPSTWVIPNYFQGAGLQVEQLGVEMMLTWGADIPGGSLTNKFLF